MALVINTNVASLNTQRQLMQSGQALSHRTSGFRPAYQLRTTPPASRLPTV